MLPFYTCVNWKPKQLIYMTKNTNFFSLAIDIRIQIMKLIIFVALCFIIYSCSTNRKEPINSGNEIEQINLSSKLNTREQPVDPSIPESDITSDTQFRKLFEERTSDYQVLAKGIIKRILRDDLEGSRHQRFIIELSSGQTLLIAHNIDIAPRVDGIIKGQVIYIYGEYEWNNNGGVIHWTHHDPDGNHPNGWIQFQGKKYQ